MAEEMSFEELQQIVSFCLDEIEALRGERDLLQSQMAEQKASVDMMLQAHRIMMESLENMQRSIETNITHAVNNVDNVIYELMDPRVQKKELFFPKICPIEQSIEEIISQRKSMARFGDGEFEIMSHKSRPKFQYWDKSLGERLKEVITSDEEGMLIGIADNYGNLEKYSEAGKLGIRRYMTEEIRKEHARYLSADRVYHNAYISRPYVLFADNMTDAPGKRFEQLKQIWDGREIIFVEGALSRLGVGNDLFDNAKKIQRIEAPATNSYDKYHEILSAAKKYGQKDTLFLIALGPAAGVLAFDLYKAGYQALDIGHVDLEYEWFLKGFGTRCEVKHKYNNEFPGGDIVSELHDAEFEKEILCTIKA